MIYQFGSMEIYKSNKHNFLGMNIIINEKEKTVTIEMEDQIHTMISEFEEETGIPVNDTNSTPAMSTLFKVNLIALELDGKKSKIFHTSTAKLLYIMKRARPDIETSVSFLLRRVLGGDVDDWIKLRHVMDFMKGTIDGVQKIRPRSLTYLFT